MNNPSGLGSLDPNVLPLDAIVLTGAEGDTERLISTKDVWKFDGERVSYPQSGYVAGRGYWQKHADGTLVQWGHTGESYWDVGIVGKTYQYPVQFFDANISMPLASPLPVSYWPQTLGTRYSASLSSTEYFDIINNNTGAVQIISHLWVAIGRWKA